MDATYLDYNMAFDVQDIVITCSLEESGTDETFMS